jgi:hypothetical protein
MISHAPFRYVARFFIKLFATDSPGNANLPIGGEQNAIQENGDPGTPPG